MKKSYIVFLLIISFLFVLPAFAAENQNISHKRYEAYGICVVSSLLEYNENFDMNEAVSYEDYNSITNFWFGEKNPLSQNPTNSDAIYDMSGYVKNISDNKNTITSFKDFGYINKDHRSAYKTMCSAGYLDFFGTFLRPDNSLKYGDFFELLMYFESMAKYKESYDISYGVITDVYSAGNSIFFKQSIDNKTEKTYSFKRKDSFYVHDTDNVAPYSYNIKKGTYAKIYTHEEQIIFVSLEQPPNPDNEDFKILKSKIFLCNEYDKQIIFYGDNNERYIAYPYDESIMVYNNNAKHSPADINILFTDTYCYFVIDTKTQKVKYINVIG